MSHFKAEFVSDHAGRWLYRFYPDHVMDPSVSGLFSVDPIGWGWEVVESASSDGRRPAAADERCVSALAHKLKQVGGDDPPETVVFVA